MAAAAAETAIGVRLRLRLRLWHQHHRHRVRCGPVCDGLAFYPVTLQEEVICVVPKKFLLSVIMPAGGSIIGRFHREDGTLRPAVLPRNRSFNFDLCTRQQKLLQWPFRRVLLSLFGCSTEEDKLLRFC